MMMMINYTLVCMFLLISILTEYLKTKQLKF
jgi:hypothetical protein